MTRPAELSARDIAHRVSEGGLSAEEVFEDCLERTLAVEPAVRAYLEIFEDDGRARARELDRRHRAGEAPGPLAGVPVAIKGNIAFAGHVTSCASRMLERYVSPFSATAVERLLDAGAVPLGITNLDEFAMGSSCEHSAFQRTRNPWNLAMVPGGSSGGSAAAVASGGVPLALGSDTGGSIRQPAAFCGIVGFKPTHGRVSRWGLVAFASSTDQIGPLARHVGDAALCLRVIAGADPRDSTCAAEAVPDLEAELDTGLEGLRIGTLGEIEASDWRPGVERSFRAALDLLAALGARLRNVSIPALEAANPCYYVLAASEASTNLARFDGLRYGHRAEVSGRDSLRDVVERSRTAGFGAEVKRRILLGTFALSSGYYDAYYHRALRVREELRRQLAKAFEVVDALVLPTAPSGAFKIGERSDDPYAMYLSDIYTTPASLAGLPALSVPCGLDERGLPLGLQILARPFDEATAGRVGRAFEKAVGWSVEPGFVEAA